MGSSIERSGPSDTVIHDPGYQDMIPRLAEQLSRSAMCPDAFRGKPDDIAIIGYSLADNGIRLSINTLPQCYVVKGRPGYMAQIQAAMAALHGIDIHPVAAQCDETSATVEVVMPGARHQVTFTMAEAVRAGLDKKPGDMYRMFPASMLVARATTRAISWYCPAVKLGLAGTVNMAELSAIDSSAQPGDRSGDTDSARRDNEDGDELIPVPAAKALVLAAYKHAHGGDDTDAAATLKLLWWAHNLPSGQQLMPRSRIDGIIARFESGDIPTRRADTGPHDGEGSASPEPVEVPEPPADPASDDYGAPF